MLKRVIFEKSNFYKEWDKSYGLLIGNFKSSELFVLLAIDCPSNPDNLNLEDNTIDSVDVNWVSQHAINILRMLPGGIRIVGFYYTSNEKSNSHLTKLHEILNEISSQEVKSEHKLFPQNEMTKIYIRIKPGNYTKFDCQKVDLKSGNAKFLSIDYKCEDLFSHYRKFQSNICMRIDATLPTERNKEKILQYLKDAMEPFITKFVEKSLMLVNGSHLEPKEEFFNKSGETGYGDNIDSFDPTATRSTEVMFVGSNMHPGADSSIESDTDTDFEMINRLKIQGRIPGVAILTTDVTAEKVEAALKEDITRSLITRLELLTEELHITGGELEISQMMLPQRVMLNLPYCAAIPLSDYKFLSETAEDVITRVQFFCKPNGVASNELDTNCIELAGTERSEQTSMEDELSEVEMPEFDRDLNHQALSQSRGIMYFIGLSALVFVISVLAYYVLI